jgi:chromosomal replication initiator protein
MTPAHHQPAAAWALVREDLRRRLDDRAIEQWIDPLRPVALEDDRLVVAAAAPLRDWLDSRFGSALQDSAARALGAGARVELIAEGATRTPDRRDPQPRGGRDGGGRDGGGRDGGGDGDQGLNPKLTFDQFVMGDSNRFAHAAALAVAEMPGQAYNPLFLYGPPGVGKTHLLHSIGHYVRAFGGGLTVRATTTERFTSEFVAAVKGKDTDRFKDRFRRADVLLIDDVQFLESKARTEEEFFHTFNALHEAGSQLVLTSDRLPRDLNALEDRLRERFAAGLVADIGSPDRAVRLAVLRKRVQHDGIVLAEPAALDVIVDRVTVDVRALEGALIRVVAFGSLTGRPITAALTAEVLDTLYPTVRGAASALPVTIERVQALTCEHFGVTLEEMLSRSRSPRLVWPRQVAMYLCREHTGASLPAIGRAFGGRDHTTVLSSCRRVRTQVAKDPAAAEAVTTLSISLQRPS